MHYHFKKILKTDCWMKRANGRICIVRYYLHKVLKYAKIIIYTIYGCIHIIRKSIQLAMGKRQPTEWEKIFANDISDKRWVCKMYKELI